MCSPRSVSQAELLPVSLWNELLELPMTFDERFDERTERQHRQMTCAGVFQSKPDQPISQPATLEAFVDLSVDERDQARPCTIGTEANHLTVDRQLLALTLRRVSHLDPFRHSHARKIRTQTIGGQLRDTVCELGARLHVELTECLA